ncbi:Trans-aconitate 2-methyltransferase, partial [Symbiodinium microadriaticum]
AKIDFTNEMIDWSRAKAPKKILDVGCGIGGSSRILGKRFPDAEVFGFRFRRSRVGLVEFPGTLIW